MSERQREELRNGGARFDIPIHEHINLYCVPAVSALLEAAGFIIVAIERAQVDVGWAKGIHLRALGRKPLVA